MDYKKNQILEVNITDMSENGEGIGKVSGYTLFVKDAVIGDRVKARLTKVKKSYSYARLEEIVIPSKHRIAAPCPISRQCGGCQLQMLEYSEQLRFKEAKVKNDLVRLGGFDRNYIESICENIVGMENPYRYRNKAQYPVGCKYESKSLKGSCKESGGNHFGQRGLHNIAEKEDKFIAGFYAGRTHNIIENEDCLIGCEENRQILNTVISYMNKEGVSAYDESKGTGTVRHILIRKGFKTGEIMVCIVVNMTDEKVQALIKSGFKSTNGMDAEEYPDNHNDGRFCILNNYTDLISALEAIPGMTSVSININNKNTNVIMGERCITLWGKDYITDYIGNIGYKISPLSFYQVNPHQTAKLYEKALEYACLKGDETVWDLYCGIGTISLFLARSAKKVYGVEIIEQAVLDARENARINGIENVEFFVGAAEDVVIADETENTETGDISEDIVTDNTTENIASVGVLGNTLKNEKSIILYSTPDVIVVDPPRKGCDEALLDTILKAKPSKIIYISCNPSTLARDLKALTAQNEADSSYELKRICAVDMFPQTVHVETIVGLQRRDM